MYARIKIIFKKLRRTVFRPYLKMFLMRLIIFYQRHISRGTCMFTPTCSEYMLRALNNHGVVIGILLGSWRIMRCLSLIHISEPTRH